MAAIYGFLNIPAPNEARTLIFCSKHMFSGPRNPIELLQSLYLQLFIQNGIQDGRRLPFSPYFSS
jgi:hypothetical protein